MNDPLFWAEHIDSNILREISILRTTVSTRLLPTFDSIEDEADAITEGQWHDFNNNFNENSDPGDIAESARDAGIDYYLMMIDVKQAITNLFSVAIHHLVEQQQIYILRKALLDTGDENNTTLMNITEFVSRLLSSGIDISNYIEWTVLEELRNVANVVKHAEGRSAARLRTSRPELFTAPNILGEDIIGSLGIHRPLFLPLSGDDLFITIEDLERYFETAESFWRQFSEDLKSLSPQS